MLCLSRPSINYIPCSSIVSKSSRLFPFLRGRTRGHTSSTDARDRKRGPDDDIKVTIGSDRYVTVSCDNPRPPVYPLGAETSSRVTPSTKQEANTPIILYLHPGLDAQPVRPSVSHLGLAANAAVVQIKYKLSAQEPYPFPVHSVLAGYDWVRKNLCQSFLGDGLEYTRNQSPKIGVCGELAGGSLATMLALTECHGRDGIRAAAVGNPVVDWISLGLQNDNRAKSKKRNTPSASVDSLSIESEAGNDLLEKLLSLRKQCFSKSESYLDPFASPLLFFRTPRVTITNPNISSILDNSSSQNSPGVDEEPSLEARRLSHRAYPPLWSDLVLPRMRVELGEENPVKEHGQELVQLMERSAGKQDQPKSEGYKNRFEIHMREGVGLWDDEDFIRIGQWFGETFRRL